MHHVTNEHHVTFPPSLRAICMFLTASKGSTLLEMHLEGARALISAGQARAVLWDACEILATAHEAL